MIKKLLNQGAHLGLAGVGLGITTGLVSDVGGNTQGLQNIAAIMPAAGTIVGAGFMLRSLHGLEKQSRKFGRKTYF